MLKTPSLFISALFLLALANLYCANSAVIGLDLGSEYMKISSISPGKSFYIVEDTTTKRKTPTSIAFQGNERFYEYDTVVKRPKAYQTTFTNLPRFLGKFFEDPELQAQGKTYLEDYLTVGNERGTVSFKLKNFRFGHEDDAEYHLSVEELMGMIFRNVKRLTQKQNERKMKDIVVTIPSFWTFKERYALSDALLLADLTPLSYIHENTAAALYYSLERQDNETHTAIFYNLGSTSLEVSLVEFQLKNSTEEYLEDEMYENFRVLAESWDENLGSLHIDLNLVNHFAKEFDALPQRKGQKSVLTSNPAKAKLLKEVARLKEILSANKQAPFYIENLFESTDFKSSMDRTTFEEINKEIFESLTKPIDEVLAKSGKTLKDIDAIELIGGGIRVPKIQQVLSEYMGEKELGFHLNGDESMALGSAFHAANFSASFKTRKIFISDGYNFDIKLDVKELESDKSIEISEGEFFPYKTPYGTKKTLELDYDGDVKCAFSAKLPGEESEENVIEFAVTGLKEALEDVKYKLKELTKPKINLYFRLNNLGLIELTKAEGVVEETIQYEEIVKKAKPAAATTTDTTTTTTTEETAETNSEANLNQEKSEETAGDATTAPETKTEEVKEEEPEKILKTKTITHRIPLKVESKIPAPGPLSPEQLAKSKELLDKFDKHEEQKKLLAEAKNRLEAFLYSTRDDLEDQAFVESSTEEEKEKLNQMLEEHREWLESDEAAKSDHVPFHKRFQDMFNIVDKVKYRIEERLLRPDLVQKAKDDLAVLLQNVGEVRKVKEWVTEEAEKKAKEEVNAVISWLSEMVEKQEVLKQHEDPVLTTGELTKQMNKAIEVFNRLRNTLKPRPPRNETLDGFKFGSDGKFDEASFREYMKKMNITFENSTFGNTGKGEEVGEHGEMNLDLEDEKQEEEKEQEKDEPQQEEVEKASEEVPEEEKKENEAPETPETVTAAPKTPEPAKEKEKMKDIDL